MSACRVCGRATAQILDLGSKPLANAFLSSPDDPEALYPLAVVACAGCGCVQLAKGVDPDVLFGGDYPYHSSVNAPYVEQCHALVDDLVEQLGLGPDDFVAEIGSNDGYLLRRYREHGVEVVGWEPASNLAAIANAAGVRTLCEFFGPRSRYLAGEARLIHANNVLAHAPDINGILVGVKAALAADGQLIVESPYVAPVVDHCLYDTIYHEHLFYWSATAFARACRRAGLALQRVEQIRSHGGSLRLWVGHQGGLVDASVAELLTVERARGISTLGGFYDRWQQRVDERIAYVRAQLVELADAGARIVGYGAAAKGTMLLNALALPEGVIEYVIDATPDKIGQHLPGVHQEVLDPSVLEVDQPDAVLVLAWNWAAAIMAQHPSYRGDWYVPAPTFRKIEQEPTA